MLLRVQWQGWERLMWAFHHAQAHSGSAPRWLEWQQQAGGQCYVLCLSILTCPRIPSSWACSLMPACPFCSLPLLLPALLYQTLASVPEPTAKPFLTFHSVSHPTSLVLPFQSLLWSGVVPLPQPQKPGGRLPALIRPAQLWTMQDSRDQSLLVWLVSSTGCDKAKGLPWPSSG